MRGEHTGIAIRDASTKKPALVALVAERTSISAKEVIPAIEPTDVILAAVSVDTKEMTAKAMTQPVASLGLDSPVLPPTTV